MSSSSSESVSHHYHPSAQSSRRLLSSAGPSSTTNDTMAAHNEAIELETKDVSNVAVSNGDDADHNSLEKQTRTRRLFSGAQLFAFSLTYMAVWEGMCE